MTNDIKTPHDHFIRAAMAHKEVAREFFEQNLPANIQAMVDLETLQLEKESYVDVDLRETISDLLFSVDFNKRKGYLYLLVEHQSTPKKFMPFRVLRYIFEIMDHHLKAVDNSQLPVIYPQIFYTGKKLYNYSTDIFDLFGEDKELAKNILLQPYQLIDLSQESDDSLNKFLFYGTIARAMKHIRDADFTITIENLSDDLHQLKKHGYDQLVQVLISYAFSAGEIPDEKRFIKILNQKLSINEGDIMTLADKYRQEGGKKGGRRIPARGGARCIARDRKGQTRRQSRSL